MSNLISMKKFRDYQPNQMLLFPPSPNDWLPQNHIAHFISEVVEHLDLSGIYNDYSELRGRPPYQPTMMVKILIYAYSKGIRSSRKIESALYEDVAFRYLSGNQQPDHWTISEFRRRHHEALGNLFVQTVRMAAEAGLVKLNQVAIDGTKIKANASKHSAMTYGYMNKEEERLHHEIEKFLEEMEQIDQEEDKIYGNRRGDELPEELSTIEKRLAAIKKAKAELERKAREKEEQAEAGRRAKSEKQGKKHQKKKNSSTPKDKCQYNFTDPESRIMLNAEKAFIQGYNAQGSVDVETMIMVAADVTNQAGDCPHLEDQVKQAAENVGHYPREVSADAGYYSDSNLKYLAGKSIEAFIPPEKVKHSTWRKQKAIRGRIPKDADTKYLMRRKLRTRHGRERYKLRQVSIEPVFGYIKEQLGLRQFLMRGLDKVRSVWRFTCAVYNLMKMFRAGIKLKTAI